MENLLKKCTLQKEYYESKLNEALLNNNNIELIHILLKAIKEVEENIKFLEMEIEDKNFENSLKDLDMGLLTL